MRKYGVTHRLSTAFHPQTSGQVEVSNRGLKRILERTIELEHKVYWALKQTNFDLTVAGDHRKIQLNEFNELRDQAYENSLIYKEKTKRIHDSKIKNHVFNVGDQVLLFNSRLKILSGKLKTRWSGPFTIVKVFPYGTVELSQADGPNFKVNGHRIKHYFGGDVPQLVVPDLQSSPLDQTKYGGISDDDSLYYENIEYVEASPHDYELVSLEVEKIAIPEDEEIEDDNLREKLLKVNLQIAKIEALKDNPTPSFEFLTKSSSTSPKPFLEETNTFHNSLPEFENFCFDLEEISSGSTTTQSDISLPEYDLFIFDLSNDHFPPTDRSDFTHEEFGDELAHIISPPEYERFYFGNLPDPGELISSLNSGIRENLSSTTCVNLPVEDDHSPLLAYVV
nr:reverse transcriptase domain-containing protein [Tanacetum cinerariifolium]